MAANGFISRSLYSTWFNFGFVDLGRAINFTEQSCLAWLFPRHFKIYLSTFFVH